MSIAYRLAGLILALTCMVLCGVYIGHLRVELQAAQEATKMAQAALKKTQATLTLREKQRAASARESASARASLNAATASNQPWAQTPVPQEVQDALCAHLDCSAGPDGLRNPIPNDSP